MILYLFWFFLAVAICQWTLSAGRQQQVQMASLFLLCLGIFVGLGDMLGGYDRYIYADLFDGMADWTRAGGNPWLSSSFEFYKGEFGYGTFCALMSYVTSNRYIFIFVMTMLIYILLVRSLKEYVDNVPMGVILFLGLWFVFTFTYLRQVLACTIVWLSVKYIVRRNLKMFLLVWFIAYSFHNSVMVFLPMYFLPIRKFSLQKVLYVMGIAFILGLSPLPSVLFNTYGEIDAARIGVDTYSKEVGFRWAYLIEAVFFLYLISSHYQELAKTKIDMVLLNVSFLFCAILLFFIRSDNGGRLAWAYMIGIMAILSRFSVKNYRITRDGMLITCVCLWLLIVRYDAWQWSNNLYPYKTFLTDGHRPHDWIRDHYEYDFSYDADHFYRPAFVFLEK